MNILSSLIIPGTKNGGGSEDFCVQVKPSYREVETLVRADTLDSSGYTRPQHLWRLKLLFEKIKYTEEIMFSRAVYKVSSPVLLVDSLLGKKLCDEPELMELTVEEHPLLIYRKTLHAIL